jgi:hypothetical protein
LHFFVEEKVGAKILLTYMDNISNDSGLKKKKRKKKKSKKADGNQSKNVIVQSVQQSPYFDNEDLRDYLVLLICKYYFI